MQASTRAQLLRRLRSPSLLARSLNRPALAPAASALAERPEQGTSNAPAEPPAHASRDSSWVDLSDSLDALAASHPSPAASAPAHGDALIHSLVDSLADAPAHLYHAQQTLPAAPGSTFVFPPSLPPPPPAGGARGGAPWHAESPTRIDRQIALEARAVDDAVSRFHSYIKVAVLRGGVGELKPIQRLLLSWMDPVAETIRQRQLEVRAAKARGRQTAPAAAFLLMVEPRALAVIAMHEAMATCLAVSSREEGSSARFTRLTARLGEAVRAEINLRNLAKLRRKRNREKKEARAAGVADEHTQRRAENNRLQARDRMVDEIVRASRPSLYQVNFVAERSAVAHPGWTVQHETQVGAYLVEALLQNCTVGIDADGQISDSREATLEPAFAHTVLQSGPNKVIGEVTLHPAIVQTVLGSSEDLRETIAPRFLPMVVSPRPWTSIDVGGYLRSKTSLLRQKPDMMHQRALYAADLSFVYQGLNVLGSQPWQVNRTVLNVASQLWQEGGNIAGLVSRADEDVPTVPKKKPVDEEFEKLDDKQKAQLFDYLDLRRKARKSAKTNRERHSLRCDTSYRLDQALEFSKEDRIYLPHSLDFRGRAYPIPAHLQHMASDLCRGMLTFSKPGRELGERGVFWLKVHLANLLGHDKLCFQDRIAAAESAIPQAIAAAQNPYSDASLEFWSTQEDPFQVLAACAEFNDATRFSGAGVRLDKAMEGFESCLPVQMDGSCNGLQHYAALGRDVVGGAQVNLLPSEKPMDVYSGVADRVGEKVAREAAAGDELAKKLLGKISRKIVKQTVMTSVYGVTRIGARQQIENRLKETMDLSDDDQWHAAFYLSKLTLSSLGDLFQGAVSTMEWLAICAQNIAKSDDSVQWITPLGLPVMQPYRIEDNKQVRTVVQSVSLSLSSEDNPVARSRQRSAFPPNYIHSLDSSHMLMTAVACADAGLNFASVHDSFWTNAADVDKMNTILREQFVKLHQKNLLEDLLQYFKARYEHNGIDFPDLPKRGELELTEVLKSQYFFD